jgi:hypothetical protein
MKPLTHSKNAVKKWGGKVEDYLPIHTWFDESKSHYADVRHRVLRHHSQGIFQCEEKFGYYITNSDDRQVAVRDIGEQHVMEDCGCIPSLSDWCKTIQGQSWMGFQFKKSKNP